MLGQWFTDQSPPVHARERGQCQTRLSRLLSSRLLPQVENIIERAPDRAGARPDGVVDAMAEIAQPVSAEVIALALGLCRVDTATPHRWSQDIGRFVSAVYRPDHARAAQWSLLEMVQLLKGHVHLPARQAFILWH